MILSDDERRHLDHNGHTRTLAVTRLSDVQSQRVEWLWPSRIPKGKLTLLVGNPGTGKSFASLAIAASISNGKPLPGGGPRPPRSVLIWNGEDRTADTIRPRAEALGADLDRLFIIDGELSESETRAPFGLLSIDLLDEHIVADAGDIDLVIVDPITALLAGVDAHKDSEIRSALQPLANFAERRDVAVLAIAHLNKKTAEQALYRVGGSIGFVGLARSVLLAAKDPEDGRCAIAPLKCNLAAMPSAIGYSIDEQGRFWWGQQSDLTADHLLRTVRPEKYGGACSSAERFLRDVLGPGPLPSKDLEDFAADRGIHPRTLRRARDELGVRTEKRGSKWVLCLPENGVPP